MAQFVFYWGRDSTVANRMRVATQAIWGTALEVERGHIRFFTTPADHKATFAETDRSAGVIAGYVRTDAHDVSTDRLHNQTFFDAIIDEARWPLGDEWTGSFGSVASGKQSRNLVLCNDLIGYVPVYYAVVDEGIVGGTSLLVLSRCLPCRLDVVGFLQRITGPYCNYGRRTLLDPICRLMPGERLHFGAGDAEPTSSFDNSLCENALEGKVDAVAKTVWDCLRREIQLAVGARRASVALSGGWDSRIVLAGLADCGPTLQCITYGSERTYETRIARLCAQAVGATHASFSVEGRYFPPRSEFEKLVRRTEALIIPDWCPILDARGTIADGKSVLLLGDHCQSIDGRYMSSLSSRAARRRSFLKGLVGQSDSFEAATSEQFASWKTSTLQEITSSILQNMGKLAVSLASSINEATVAERVAGDLELSCGRVQANQAPFAPMYDELFTWFHKTRFYLCSQNLLLSDAFRAYSPTMSMRSLRLLSRVPPRLRLRRRLMDALARLPDFEVLAKVPSAQIPWVSARAPSLFREMIWAARSGADQFLLRRALQSKDPRKRQRVLKSADFVAEYGRENTVRRVSSWFSGRWIKAEPYVEIAQSRADLVAWPLINSDITAPANISLLLDQCELSGVADSRAAAGENRLAAKS